MKHIIVTTTIHSPTKAMRLFVQKSGWSVIIVGDKKTPHNEYKTLEKKHQNVLYLSPEDQEKKYSKLSDAIGWNSIQRRSIGFIEAYRNGAEIVATVDDDNIPYAQWGKNLLVGKTVTIEYYHAEAAVFDPLSVTPHSHLWHRGYPIDLLQDRLSVRHTGTTKRTVRVQADLWDGDPDVDAIARMVYHPMVKFPKSTRPFASDKISPFDSQNTFISREIIPVYMMIPHIGRFDDIWASYIVQHYFPDSVAYCAPSVYQERNTQDVMQNFEDEIIGYRHTSAFIKHLNNYMSMLPKRSAEAYRLYRRYF